MARAADLFPCCQDLPLGLASVYQAFCWDGNMEEASLYLQGVPGQGLPSFTRGTTGGYSGSIENPIVARAEESVVLSLPPDLAPQMGAGTGKSHEILNSPLAGLPGDVDGFAGRALEEERFPGLDGVYLSHKLPGELIRPGRVKVAEGDSAKAPIPPDQPGGHGSFRRLLEECPPIRAVLAFGFLVFCHSGFASRFYSISGVSTHNRLSAGMRK